MRTGGRGDWETGRKSPEAIPRSPVPRLPAIPARLMAVTLTLPLWLAIVLGLLALWSALDRLLIPSARWFLRRRVNRVLEEINTRLKIRIPPFKLTKREVLIDRLLYDPQVQEAAEAEAREAGRRARSCRTGSTATRGRSFRPSTPTSTSDSATGWRETSRARSTASGSATPTSAGSPPSARTRRSCFSSTTAATWTTSSCPTWRPRRPRSPTRSASGRASGRSRRSSARWGRTS